MKSDAKIAVIVNVATAATPTATATATATAAIIFVVTVWIDALSPQSHNWMHEVSEVQTVLMIFDGLQKLL